MRPMPSLSHFAKVLMPPGFFHEQLFRGYRKLHFIENAAFIIDGAHGPKSPIVPIQLALTGSAPSFRADRYRMPQDHLTVFAPFVKQGLMSFASNFGKIMHKNRLVLADADGRSDQIGRLLVDDAVSERCPADSSVVARFDRR